MIIKTTLDQDDAIVKWYRLQIAAHHNEGLEPPGYSLVLSLGIPEHYGFSATVVCGDSQLEIGEVDVTFNTDRQFD